MRHKQFPPSGGPVKLGTPIVLDHGDDFFEEYRALVLARVAKEGERFYWARASDTPTQDLGSTHLDILAVARLRPHGDIGYKVETLRLLLTGVQRSSLTSRKMRLVSQLQRYYLIWSKVRIRSKLQRTTAATNVCS
jgi:hypothetical protein